MTHVDLELDQYDENYDFDGMDQDDDQDYGSSEDSYSTSSSGSKKGSATVSSPSSTVGMISNNDGPEFKWYVVQVLTSNENKVLKSIKERVYNHHLEDFFSQVLIPEETVVSNVRGKKRAFKKKFFPGYVLIKMILNDKTWHLVQNTDKVTVSWERTKITPFLSVQKKRPI